MRFEKQVALVTGGARGMGRTCALRFAAEGAAVVVADVDERGGAAIVDEIGRGGGAAAFVACDVGDAGDVGRLIEEVERTHGRLDVLHNNAAVTDPLLSETPTSHQLEDEVFDEVLRVNLKGVWLCSKQAVPLLAADGGGAIVNAASVAGMVAWPPATAYGAAKAGVIQLTRMMATELAPMGIRVNCYSPSVIDTPMVRRFYEELPDDRRDAVLADLTGRNLIPRLGTEDDVAELVLFLASERAAFITGENVSIDGGVLAWRGQRDMSERSVSDAFA